MIVRKQDILVLAMDRVMDTRLVNVMLIILAPVIMNVIYIPPALVICLVIRDIVHVLVKHVTRDMLHVPAMGRVTYITMPLSLLRG